MGHSFFVVGVEVWNLELGIGDRGRFEIERNTYYEFTLHFSANIIILW